MDRFTGGRWRGLSSTAAFVALSRKLARVCFALLKNHASFNPQTFQIPCTST
jgi:hypothetical protein